ncbi:DUF5305 family protein [Chloroflexota bacterium]
MIIWSFVIKNKAIFITSIVLLALIVGACRAFTSPAEIEEQIEALSYEHKGEFDYLAYLHASYLFDDIPLETNVNPESPLTNPKYPFEIIDSIDLNFSYRFVPDKPVIKISEQVEVKAIFNRQVVGREEVILVPLTHQPGDFTVSFPVNVSDLASSFTTTIEANVYATVETDTGPMFESFSQDLTVVLKGPLLEVSKDLTNTQQASFGDLSYEQSGRFYYFVHLKPSSPFGPITLEPHSLAPLEPPVLPSSKTIGPGETILSKLFDRMDVAFSYSFEPDWAVSRIAEEVAVNAIIENPGVWSKTFVLVPPTKKNGGFTVTFPLDNGDFSNFIDVYKAIGKETGVSTPYNLTIKADVHTTAQTDFGPIDEEFSQTLSTVLGNNILAWEEELIDSKPGAIEMSRMIPNPNKFVGLSIIQIRILSTSLAGLIVILLAYLIILKIRFKPEKLSPIEEEALLAIKKHRDVIVDIGELPEAQDRETVIQLSSLDELVKAADGLLKPVLHKVEAHKHTYCVIDGLTRYEYISE